MKLIIKKLQDSPQTYDQMIDLVERSFGYEQRFSVTEDFAPLFSKNTKAQNFLFLNSSNTVVGHIGVLEKKMCYQGEEYPIIFIGGVCVAKEFRNQGLVAQMMGQVLSRYDGKYTLALLWSSMTELYEKFGFYEAGQVIQTGSDTLEQTPNGFQRTDISKCSQQNWQWVQSAYNERSSREAYIKREQADWNIIKEMKSVSLYLRPKTQDYFMMNKGMDLPGIIHEHSPGLTHELSNYRLWAHPQDTSVQKPEQLFYLAFVKLGRQSDLAKLLSRYSDNEIELCQLEEDKVHLKSKGKNLKVHPKEFLQSLFGPGRPLLAKMGPICFTIGGVDSV